MSTSITSVANERVKALVRLHEHKERRATGLFLAEGGRAAGRALAAGLAATEVWVCPELLGEAGAETRAAAHGWLAAPGVRSFEATAPVFRKASYLEAPEGLLVVCRTPAFDPAVLAAPGPALVLVAVGTEKPGNLGAMVRTADAAGCRAVVVAGTPVDAFNPNAVRASTGAVFSLPTLGLSEDEAIARLRAADYRILAAFPDPPAGVPLVDAFGADYAGRVALVIGPEDTGLAPAWARAAADSGGACVGIPMRGRTIDSLNASVAAGILLFEAARKLPHP